MKHVITAFILSATTLTAVAQTQYSPFINKVYEYSPAPGQFVNQYPRYEAGDDASTMCDKASRFIVGNARSALSLGAYGGYVVFGFDHTIENIVGKMDFQVLGNAFISEQPTRRYGGSSEPGIIMVSRDANGNGLPDDPWYEIAGSEYNSPATIHNYRITYYRSTGNVLWRDNQGRSGYVDRNDFHTQDSYYPQWLTADSLTFAGTKLADNAEDESGQGSYYVQYCYPYGYADNQPNDTVLSKINIDWAVDSLGHPAMLTGIDFVKVYTGINQKCGWLGETSTEVAGAIDLHMTGGDVDDHASTGIVSIHNSKFKIQNYKDGLYNLQGQRVTTPQPGRVYIVRKNGLTRKVTWKK